MKITQARNVFNFCAILRDFPRKINSVSCSIVCAHMEMLWNTSQRERQ